jgi:hypothetical protein
VRIGVSLIGVPPMRVVAVDAFRGKSTSVSSTASMSVPCPVRSASAMPGRGKAEGRQRGLPRLGSFLRVSSRA